MQVQRQPTLLPAAALRLLRILMTTMSSPGLKVSSARMTCVAGQGISLKTMHEGACYAHWQMHGCGACWGMGDWAPGNTAC